MIEIFTYDDKQHPKVSNHEEKSKSWPVLHWVSVAFVNHCSL